MNYPLLNELETSRLMTGSFPGLDRRPRTQDGACQDMENMTGDPAPLLSSRKQRGLVTTLTSPQAMIAAGKLAYIDGTTLYYDGAATPVNDLSADKAPKRLVTMGAYILIFPDGAYYNTVDAADYGSINRLYASAEGQSITCQLCQMDGTVYDNDRVTTGDTAPASPADGDYWVDTAESVHVLKQWRDGYGMWLSVATVYVRIGCPGIGAGLRAGDAVDLSGIAGSGADESLNKQLSALNGSHTVQACGEDYLVVAALIDRQYTQTTGTVRADRKAPDMDFVIECNNRLWGCYHGPADGKMLNEIYASALGDFRNWRRYTGTSQDSYTVSVGSDGPFTGAITYRNYPYFFKEGGFHKILGAVPKNFEMQTTACDGVRAGCAGTLRAVNGTLYYLGRNGVCALDSLPMDVSSALGSERFTAGVAGDYDGKYYISMQGTGGAYSLYCLDTAQGTWHREDAAQALAFARVEDELYMLLADGRLYALNGTAGTPEGPVSWRADSAVMGYEYPDNKYLSRLNLRMKLGAGASCTLAFEYDSSGVWEPRGTLTGGSRVRTYTLPVRPRRCDHLRIRLSGTGEMQLYSVARILEIGGDG